MPIHMKLSKDTAWPDDAPSRRVCSVRARSSDNGGRKTRDSPFWLVAGQSSVCLLACACATLMIGRQILLPVASIIILKKVRVLLLRSLDTKTHTALFREVS